jgi:hypothetical protein
LKLPLLDLGSGSSVKVIFGCLSAGFVGLNLVSPYGLSTLDAVLFP